jgi:hypothetical protein
MQDLREIDDSGYIDRLYAKQRVDKISRIEHVELSVCCRNLNEPVYV